MYRKINVIRTSAHSGDKGLRQRYQEQLDDPGNFYVTNQKAWKIHSEKFKEDQRGLQKLIKQAKKMGCYIPPEVEWWATIEPPEKPNRHK